MNAFQRGGQCNVPCNTPVRHCGREQESLRSGEDRRTPFSLPPNVIHNLLANVTRTTQSDIADPVAYAQGGFGGQNQEVEPFDFSGSGSVWVQQRFQISVQFR